MKDKWTSFLNCSEETAETVRNWEKFLDAYVEFWHYVDELHTKSHAKRVLLFSQVIAEKKNMNTEDRQALAQAAVFHDSRRVNDWYDTGHGKRAAQYYREFCKNGDSKKEALQFDRRTYYTIAMHDRPDADGEAAIRKSFPEPSEQNRALLIYRVFKDADALDRYRISLDALDPKYLRTEEAAGMTEAAKRIVTDVLGRPLTPHWRDAVKIPADKSEQSGS